MTAKQILELIESVDPKDTDKLDEIDARVEWFLGVSVEPMSTGLYKYTRSRDALKQIRPDGKIMWCFFENYPEGARARAEIFHDHGDNPIQTGWFPTEELAELHAIIQAIEYERSIA